MKAKQIDEKFIAPHNPQDGKLGVTLETEGNGGFRLVAEWSYAPVNAEPDHGSSQTHDDEENASLSAASGRSKPLETNNDKEKLATNVCVPCVSIAAQTSMQRIPGSSNDGIAVENATTRSRLRSVRVPKPGSNCDEPVVVKKGMFNLLTEFCRSVDHCKSRVHAARSTMHKRIHKMIQLIVVIKKKKKKKKILKTSPRTAPATVLKTSRRLTYACLNAKGVL